MDSTTEIFNKIINKECRKLSSGGFKDVVKFYKRNLKIDIGNIQPGTSRMEEIHTRRHLLVHKLGKTDKTYRKKYNTTASTVEISEEYLLEVLEDFKSFAILVNNQIKYKLDTEFNNIPSVASSNSKRLEIEITHPKDYEFDFLQSGYEFWAGDEYSKSEKVTEKVEKVNEYTTNVILDGDRDLIKKLFRFIKRRCKKMTFDYKIIGNNQNQNDNFEQNILDSDLILKIKSKLPQQPWQKGIHKIIAKELNISNNLSSIGIQQLIVNGDFKRQIGQRIVE